jgi:hypothetical protein
MKKFLLGIALVLMASSSFAQAKLSFEPASFELKAGETQLITVYLEGADTCSYQGLSMVLEMPDNLELEEYYDEDKDEDFMVEVLLPSSIFKNEKGRNDKSIVSAFQSNVDYTFVRKGHQYKEYDEENQTFVPGRIAERDELTLVFFNTKGYNFPGHYTGKTKTIAKEPLFLFQVKATDKCYTETSSFDAHVILTTKTSETEKVDYTLAKENPASVLTYNIEYKLTGEYGTIAWPVALDFSKNNFKAVGTGRLTQDKKGMMINEGVTKFAEAEPLIINGEPGTYNLYTTRDEVAKDADNVLEGTPDAPLKVTENNVYALADKTAEGYGVGFWHCQENVEIPQYKAYYHSNDAAVDAFIFEGTTGIREAVAGEDASDTYTISGVKVNNTNKKGVYIVNGKKVVVK